MSLPPVAIVGFCESTRMMVRWFKQQHPDGHVWCLNNGYIFLPMIADAWFEMHNPSLYEWHLRRPEKHVQWLAQFAGPVYLHQARPEVIPNSVTFPLAEIAADLGLNTWRVAKGEDGAPVEKQMTELPYLTSSIAYMIALAIYQRYPEIHLYGIDLNTQGEYAWQKPNAEWMLGLAAGRGIKIVVPDDCALMKGDLYGRGHLKPEGEWMQPDQYANRLAAVDGQINQKSETLQQLRGAHRELRYLQDQMVPGLDWEKLDQRRIQMEAGIGQLDAELKQLFGAKKELVYWIHQTPGGQPPDQAIQQLSAAAMPENPNDVLEGLPLIVAAPASPNGHVIEAEAQIAVGGGAANG